MIKFNLANKDGMVAHFHRVDSIFDQGLESLSPITHADVLEVGTIPSLHGQFKTASGTTAATTIVTAPINGGAIVLTDLLIAGEKKNGGTIELRFTDGTNTITIYKAPLTDNAIAVAIPFTGHWRGWKDARLEVVTVQDFTYSVACGYYKCKQGLTYSDWDARR